jgi:hypothetical protein
MQFSLLAIQVFCVSQCQGQGTADNSEIIAKFRELLYDDTTLPPDYEDTTDTEGLEVGDVTLPSTTGAPTTPVSTTGATLEDDNLSEDDLELNNKNQDLLPESVDELSNVVQSALEPRQLDLLPDTSDDSNDETVTEKVEPVAVSDSSVTFPDAESIPVISQPIQDISGPVLDSSQNVPGVSEAVPETDEAGEIAAADTDLVGYAEVNNKATSSKWFYYSGHAGLVPHYWPTIKSWSNREELNEIEDRVKVAKHPLTYPYYHPRQYSYPYVYFYRSDSHV